MGAFAGSILICVALAFIYEEAQKIRRVLETLAQREVDSERCKCQICDGQVPTMKERRSV
jgi:hypothetical protein